MTLLLQEIANGLSLGFAYALIALGFSLVFGTLKILNFAHGDVLMLSAFVGSLVLAATGENIFLASAAGILFAGLVSILIYVLLVRPVADRSFISPFVTTLGASLLFVALARQEFGSESRAYAPSLHVQFITLGGARFTTTQLTIAAVAVVTMALLGLLLYRTRIGLLIRASAENAEIARTSGVDTRVIFAAAMGLAGLLAGVAATLLGLSFGIVSAYTGSLYGLKGMVVMIIGGIGSLRGAVIAGVGIGLGEVLTATYVSSNWRDAIAFGLLILILIIRPTGLMGRRIAFVIGPSA
jgi:branched-chain amino acid transport system permease protein